MVYSCYGHDQEDVPKTHILTDFFQTSLELMVYSSDNYMDTGMFFVERAFQNIFPHNIKMGFR